MSAFARFAMPSLSTAAGYSARLHRRPAFAINSPAILCHRCYSFKDEDAPGGVAADLQLRRDRTASLNKILRAIQTADRPAKERTRIRVYKEEGTPDPAAGDGVDRAGRQETILASLHILDQSSANWSGWRARMRVDIHIEYYSVTFILDRRDLQTTLERSPENPPSGATEAKRYVSEWYRLIWDEFFALIETKGIALDFPTDDQFFECRGLVLDTAPQAAPLPIRPRYPILDERIFATRRAEAKESLNGWVDENGDVMSRILRLDRSAGNDQDANCVLCYVMNGRGIYASSMGRSEAELRSKPGGTTQATPERYLLLHHGLPRFQVGRVLRRFHVLDELRCATAFHFRELIDASKRIREAGDNIDQQLRDSKDALTRDSLKTIQHDLNALTSNQRIGGLLYRINRSRYYARNFKLGMDDLRFAPVKGWEPYDAFMHRNLFPTIDHIDGIGQRFEALASRVERLTEERDVTESINVQNRIADIQEIGEIIGWTAAAYYAGQIFGKVIQAIQYHCKPGGALVWSDFCNAIPWVGYDLAGLMISCPLAYWLYTRYKRRREMRSGQPQ